MSIIPWKRESLADRLGELKSRIAKLEEEQASLRREIIESGQDVVPGELFDALVITSVRSMVEWKRLAEETGIPADVIDKYTKRAEITTVRVVTHKARS